jgi:hypothetical protein
MRQAVAQNSSSGNGQVTTDVRSNEKHPQNIPRVDPYDTFHLERSELNLVQPANMLVKQAAFATFHLERSELNLQQPRNIPSK